MWGQLRAGSSPAPGILKRVIFFFISLLLVIGYMLFAALRNYSYYLNADELYLKSSQFEGKNVKVSGVAFKIKRENREARFFIQENGKGVYVTYKGAIPDAFGEGVPVVVEGVYKDETIKAKTLLTKCPSKYESASK